MSDRMNSSSCPNSSTRTAYALAAGAAAAAALNASGAVVYSGVQDIAINQFSSLNLNLDGDASGDLLLKNYVFGGGNYQGATVNFFPGKLMSFNANGLAYVSALDAGVTVSSSSVGPSFFGSMAYGGANPNAQFNNASNKYLGLSFASGANTYYGWVRLSLNNAAGTFMVHDWAFEDTGGSIQTGAVPAPGTLGILAAGASGLGLLRGRKRTK
jgi:hypothetical protein